MSLAAGQEISRYVIENELGSGSTATVYRVRHKQLGSAFALKVLEVPSHTIRDRMRAEGRVQATLKHPNVVRVVDIFEIENHTALVLELVRGPSMERLLAQGRIADADAMALFGGILAGMDTAHRLDLTHRDLKPENVLLHVSHAGVFPKVADFGLARGGEASENRRATMPGIALGTPAYMAPEQITDASTAGQSADIFALGCLLYELFTGKIAFAAPTAFETMGRIRRVEYTPIEELRPDVPAGVAEAVRRCLQADPAQRPDSCCEIAGLLASKPTPASVTDVLPDHIPDDSPATELARSLMLHTPEPAPRVLSPSDPGEPSAESQEAFETIGEMGDEDPPQHLEETTMNAGVIVAGSVLAMGLVSLLVVGALIIVVVFSG